MTAPSETHAPSNPGNTLRVARESLGYSIQDMADALNLSARVVADVEAERFGRFPAIAFARGHVRAYAKLLGLDGEGMIDGCAALREQEQTKQALPAARVVSAAYGRGLTELASRRPGAVMSAAVGIAVSVVLVVLYLVWPDGSPEGTLRQPALVSAPSSAPRMSLPAGFRASVPTAPTHAPPPDNADPDEAIANPDLRRGAPERVAVPARSIAPVRAAALPQFGDADAVEEIVVATDDDADSEMVADMADASAEPLPARAPQSRERRIGSVGADRVAFDFTQSCWVEVSDAGGNTYGDLSIAGDSLVLIGQAPFKIRLGYGPGASVAFNGQAVVLAPHTRRNITSLVLDASADLDP